MFKSKMIRQFDDVLDWTPVRKAVLVLALMVITLVHNWVFQVYQIFFPSPYINHNLLRIMQGVMPGLILGACLLIWLSKRLKKSQQAHWWFVYICLFYYVMVLVGLGYLIGLSNITTGLVLVGSPIFAFMLFPRYMVYQALSIAVLLVVVLIILSAFDYIPYGPLFNPEFFYHREAQAFRLASVFYFSLPHFILIFGFCDLFFIRWRERERKIHHISITDSLTELYNRHAISGLLHDTLNRDEELAYPVSVILLDIDFFKTINDTHGHAIGDKVLQVVALTLQNTLRKTDQVGRYGGEEFLVVLGQTSLEQATAIAERCRDAIHTAYISNDQGSKLEVTASFGVSCSDYCGYKMDKMVRQADRYLYRAKAHGRNRVVSRSNTATL